MSYWLDSPNGRQEYLHLLFRFPARFHPPVVRWALQQHDGKGFVLDPFTGSGTVQLEALARGISSLGIDVDPLSCLVAKAKTTPLDPKKLREALTRIKARFSRFTKLHAAEEGREGADIGRRRYEQETKNLWIPDISNLSHWFRRYVIVDLARILTAIERTDLSPQYARFFRVCAASIIRRVSNADPAPVSGLEVTSVQAERNATRRIKVFAEFFRKVELGIQGMEALQRARSNWRDSRAKVLEGDIGELGPLLEENPMPQSECSLVVTSPPYCRSVEYSRRHRLELYWLGLVMDDSDHLDLAHRYIGRNTVRESDWNEDVRFDVPALDKTIERVEAADPGKGRGVRHYFFSMDQVLGDLAARISPSGTMVWVVGDSICCGVRIRTADFIAELAQQHFKLSNRFSYALRNHYMQYGLWNGAGIKEEHVLVLKPKRGQRLRGSG